MTAESRVPSERLGDAHLFRDAIYAALYPTNLNLFYWLSWIFALGAEIALVLVLSTGRVYGWEQDVTRNLEAVPGRTATFQITSTLTDPSSVLVVSLFLAVTAFIASRGQHAAAMLLLLSFPMHLLVEVPKALVARPGPSSDFDGITGVGGFDSFPSAPAEYVITFYGFLAYLLILRYARDWQRNIILWSWVAFALVTGFSGIAEGYHWPLDVVASYVAGLGILSALIWLHEGFRAARAEHAAAAAEETADFVAVQVRSPVEPAGDPESHPTPRL